MDCKEWLYDWEYNSDDFKKYNDLLLYPESCFEKKRQIYKLYRGY